jgi:phospholipid N-methyltransferase
VLDVPAHILHQRKDEQDISTLERQRQFYLRLSQERDNVAVVEATAGADQVRLAVTALMWQQFVGQRRRFASAKEAGSAALKGSKR